MSGNEDLTRFFTAQETQYAVALAEITKGKKRSHWMWYIFPQIKGLGFSEIAHFYGIMDIQEAKEYLAHPVLGKRLIQISQVLLGLDSNNANSIFGSPDDLKLKSCMTLFASVSSESVFQQVLDKFFGGVKDAKTLQLIDKS